VRPALFSEHSHYTSLARATLGARAPSMSATTAQPDFHYPMATCALLGSPEQADRQGSVAEVRCTPLAHTGARTVAVAQVVVVGRRVVVLRQGAVGGRRSGSHVILNRHCGRRTGRRAAHASRRLAGRAQPRPSTQQPARPTVTRAEHQGPAATWGGRRQARHLQHEGRIGRECSSVLHHKPAPVVQNRVVF